MTLETAAEDAAPSPVELVDDLPARIRRTTDLFWLAGVLALIIVTVLLGTFAHDGMRTVSLKLIGLFDSIPAVLVRAVSLIGALSVLAMPVAIAVHEIARGRARRLVEGLIAGVVTIGVVELLDMLLSAHPDSGLYDSFTAAAAGSVRRPLDAYLAAVVAFSVLVRVIAEPGWRMLFWLCTGVYVVSAFLASQASVLSLIAGPAIGAALGLIARYAAGSPNNRPDGHRVIAALLRRGIAVRRLERVTLSGERHRSYHATTDTGDRLVVQVFDRDLVTTGAVSNLYRRLRVRTAIAAPPALSLERMAEQRCLLAVGGAAAGAHTPEFVAGVPCGPDAVVLVFSHVPRRVLSDPTNGQLIDLWRNVELLHEARMTHHDLTTTRILLDDDGRIVLPIPSHGAVFASDVRVSLARAQVLITTTQMVGAARAVEAARAVLTDDELGATVPLLQAVALPRESRAAVRKNTDLLPSVREQISQQAAPEPVRPVRIERFRPRTMVAIATLIVAAYLVIAQLGSVDLATVFGAARWEWVPPVFVASAAIYFAAALSFMGYVPERLPYGRTVLVQLAVAFVGFLAPKSVGGIALNVRYLRRRGISATGAAVSVSLSQGINGVSHVLLLLIVGTATGVAAEHNLPIPGWAFIVLGAVAVGFLALLAVPAPRRWFRRKVEPRLRDVLPRLLELVTNPARLVQALGGLLLINVVSAAALWFSVRAFGGTVSVLAVAVVYLAGAGVGSLSPTPGGLGAVELALSTGLAASGMAGTAAASAVLLFRIATFWLPAPAGWLAFQHLRRREAL